MKSRIVTACILMTASICFAQFPGGPRGMRGAGTNGQAGFANLKAYLGLSDAQVQSLQQVGQSARDSSKASMQQLMQKEQQLQTALQQGNTDAAALGQMLIDIQALRRSTNQSRTTLQSEAANVLNADQKAKLKTLEDAAKLQPSVREAMALHLITPTPGAGGPGRFGPQGFRPPYGTRRAPPQ